MMDNSRPAFRDTPLGRDLAAEERDFFGALAARDREAAAQTRPGKERPMRRRRTEHRPGIRATKRTGG